MDQVLAAVAAQFRPGWRAGRAMSGPVGMVLLALLYIGLSFGLRSINFDNPVVHIDEEFYLFVGDRLRRGALPFVDIWDRKPIGLFLLYGWLRGFSADGVAAYQVGAACAAGLTALIVSALARRIAPPAGGWWAGVAYLLALPAFHCQGGQTPVFYNLPVTGALLLLVQHVEGLARNRRAAIAPAVQAMALLGLAIQLKYTVAFEGAALGLWLLWHYRRLGVPAWAIVGRGALFAGVALGPTLAVCWWYGAHGHFAELFQSNFISIFQRDQPLLPGLGRLAKETLGLTPFLLAIRHGRHRAGIGQSDIAGRLLGFWGIAAVAAFLLFGSWFDHYVGAILPPLAILAAPGLARGGKLNRFGGLLLGAAAIAAGFQTLNYRRIDGNRAQVERASALIASRLGGGSLFLFEAPPILYLTTGAALPSRYVFPTHLSSTVEARALGVNQAGEVSRIMAGRPAVVMMATECHLGPKNLATWALMNQALARDYVHYADSVIGIRHYALYARRST